MFNGQNILDGFPEGLTKVVGFLLEKAKEGEFVFSESLSYWADNEDIINPLGLSHEGNAYYFAVSLAYLAHQYDGNIPFSEKDHVWRWAWSLHIIAAVAQWQPEFLQRVIDSVPRERDGIESLIGNAAQTYGRTNYEQGLALMQLTPQYWTEIMAGLMENDFERYCRQYPPEKDPETFANVIVRATLLPQENVQKAFDVAYRLPAYTSASAMNSFLVIHSRLDDPRRGACEKKVTELLKKEDTAQYVNPVSNWILQQNENTPFLQECALLLVAGLKKEESECLAAIDRSIAFNHDDSAFIVELVVAVVEHLGPLEVLKLEGCINSLRKKKDEFISFVLSFLLHPKGLHRLVGRKLWDEYHLEASDFNVFDLDGNLQCVFIISMLQDFGNPETRLPKVLPLLESDSKQVRGILRRFLRPYLDDYMGHVINALDKLTIENDEVKDIRRYFEGRSKLLHERRMMKELSPLYTDGKAFREALRRQNEHFQEEMKEAEKEHKPMWHDFMNTVILARGGGWREADGSTHHIPVTRFSMPSRQMKESMSPKEQDEWLNDIAKDWDDTTRNH